MIKALMGHGLPSQGCPDAANLQAAIPTVGPGVTFLAASSRRSSGASVSRIPPPLPPARRMLPANAVGLHAHGPCRGQAAGSRQGPAHFIPSEARRAQCCYLSARQLRAAPYQSVLRLSPGRPARSSRPA